jgi:hypothetical protein
MRRIARDRWRNPAGQEVHGPACRDQHRDGPDRGGEPSRLFCAAHSADPTQRIAGTTRRTPTGRPRSDFRNVGLGSRPVGPVDGSRLTMIDATSSSRRVEQGVARLAGLAGRLGFTGHRAGRTPRRGRRHRERSRCPTSPPTADDASGSRWPDRRRRVTLTMPGTTSGPVPFE